MKGLEQAKWPLSTEERHILYRNMLSNNYYGEQHATRIIEEKLQIRFLIFNGDLEIPQLSWFQAEPYHPTHYCFLYLAHLHYNPVSFSGLFVWKWEDLPLDIQFFFSKAYSHVNDDDSKTTYQAVSNGE